MWLIPTMHIIQNYEYKILQLLALNHAKVPPPRIECVECNISSSFEFYCFENIISESGKIIKKNITSKNAMTLS